MSMNGLASCATDAQKAPPRLPARGSASMRSSAKKAPAMSPMRGENALNDASMICRASGNST